MDQPTFVLLQTVGTGGPHNPVWEALAKVVVETRPHILVQICSKRTEQETLPKYKQALGELDPHFTCQERVHVLRDEDNVETSLDEIVTLIDGLRIEFPQVDLRIDYTSGTKAMSGAAVAAAVGRQLSKLYYTTGQRDESGRVTRSEKVVDVGTDQAYGDLALLELGRLFNRGQFDAVFDQALRLLPCLVSPVLRARASSLVFLADVYRQWERFAYDKAYCRLRNFRSLHKCEQFLPSFSSANLEANGCETAGWPMDQLEAQVNLVRQLKTGNDGCTRLVDLWENANRRVEEGRFDDAVARLYRLAEYLAQMRFCKIAHLPYNASDPTSGVDRNDIDRLAPKFVTNILKDDARKQRVDLTLNNTVRLLDECGDTIGRKLREQCHMEDRKGAGELGELLKKRNRSLLAHGTVPVKQETAEELLRILAQYVLLHVNDLKLNFDKLRTTAKFLTCPWTKDEE